MFGRSLCPLGATGPSSLLPWTGPPKRTAGPMLLHFQQEAGTYCSSCLLGKRIFPGSDTSAVNLRKLNTSLAHCSRFAHRRSLPNVGVVVAPAEVTAMKRLGRDVPVVQLCEVSGHSVLLCSERGHRKGCHAVSCAGVPFCAFASTRNQRPQ